MAYEQSEDEREALRDLAGVDNPMARVIYHMSNRQLAMHEMLIAHQHEMMRLVGAVRRIAERQEKIAEYIDDNFKKSNGSSPSLRLLLEQPDHDMADEG